MSVEIDLPIEKKRKKAKKKQKSSEGFMLFDEVKRKMHWFRDKELKEEIGDIIEHTNTAFNLVEIGEKAELKVYLYNPHPKYPAFVKELYITHPDIQFELERADIAPKSAVEVTITFEPSFEESMEFRSHYMFRLFGGWCPFDQKNEGLQKKFQETVEAQQRKKLPKNLRKRAKNAR